MKKALLTGIAALFLATMGFAVGYVMGPDPGCYIDESDDPPVWNP
jgi:hypothetical protein